MKELKNRAFEFSIEIINFTEKFPNRRFYWVIGDQLLRSATSIGANITEAVGACSRKDFVNFYFYSLKSANETIYWLKILKAKDNHNQEKIQGLLNEVSILAKIIGKSIVTLRKNR